jgi:hypothetical protein
MAEKKPTRANKETRKATRATKTTSSTRKKTTGSSTRVQQKRTSVKNDKPDRLKKKEETDAKRIEANKEKLLNALVLSLGVVTTACKKAKLSRDTFYTYYNEDKEFARLADETKDIALDTVESELFKQIKRGSVPATIFFLKTKGQERGYIEKKQIEDVTPRRPDLSEMSTDEIREYLNKFDEDDNESEQS